MDECCFEHRVIKTLKRIRSEAAAERAEARMMHEEVMVKLSQITGRLDIMAAREDAAWEKQAADVAAVKAGWDTLVASNAVKDQRIADLEAALEAAGGDVQAQIDAALEVDSEGDAVKVEAANAALEALTAPPVPGDGGGDNIPPLG